MKLSEIIGREAASIHGERRGYIIGVSAQGNKLEYLLCADEAEREFAVCADDVTDYSDVVAFKHCCIKRGKPSAIRLGRACYDESGAFLGHLTDYEIAGNRIKFARIGRKRIAAENLICGDIIIVKRKRVLRDDVIKDGRVILARGTELCDEVMDFARENGEYIQTYLKSM